MKKVWLGMGIVIVLIAIGCTIAQRMVPTYVGPIRVLSGGLCVMILLAVPLGVIIKNFDVKNNDGAIDKTAVLVIVVLVGILLGAFVFAGVKSVKAAADIVNGPKEKIVYAAIIEEKEHRGHKGRKDINCYMKGISVNGEEVKLTVSEEKRKEVKSVLSEAKWKYGIKAKYKVYYFENLGSLYEIQMINIDEEY